ncbi:hypothetical protein [Halobacillus litoralis]|uniref:Uncharacterized protein n=1 Tax=Halobacillus litoralis TaxID=45668 RepID=A0A410MD02_9BACI|nr:hypothetical protein [Halobacillus litoralis]QAS52599.1 hypothetical protein HLI_10395 [Halobacillus litoralis]
MPAWFSHSLKIVSSIFFYIIGTVALIGAVLYTILTGLTLFKTMVVIGLFLSWLVLYIIVIQKIYRYLFGSKNDDDQ